MNRYTLTARLNERRSNLTLWAVDDSSAMFEAIFKILDKATTSPLWSKGRIELKNSKGEVINSMEAKE